MSFHINDDGDVLPCKAKLRKCEYGAANHFETEDLARKVYELRNRSISTQGHRSTGESVSSSGYTPNVENLISDLEDLATHLGQYQEYRRTGLNDPKLAPKVPQHLEPYLDGERIASVLEKQNYDAAVKLYGEAYKRYYMRSVFTQEDVDYLPEDEVMERVLKSKMRRIRR